MRRCRSLLFAAVLLAGAAVGSLPGADPAYVKKATRTETVLASLKANRLPTLEGKWYLIGPFDNADNQGFDTAYPPEKEIDLHKTYPGKDGKPVAWRESPGFRVGQVYDLTKPIADKDQSCAYLYHEFDVQEENLKLPLSLGSDDGLALWLNGRSVLSKNVERPAAPDQDHVLLELKPGKNHLLAKVCNAGGDWAFYVCPEFPVVLDFKLGHRLAHDFPVVAASANSQLAREAAHYRMVNVPIPKDVVLEVGGLAFRPDGKLLVCTRRGEVWTISHPEADDPGRVKYQLFATGLHEPLGLLVEGNDVYTAQRPELTKLVDRDGDGVVDEYVAVSDRWGVSGDYHEFAYGPVRDRDGNFVVTLNVGYGGGHPSKAPWRGWCIKITPKGDLIPVAAGMRSPNGVNVSPEGDLFYCDNQGEWVASCKMHHIRPGDYYGHPAGLRWVKYSPFAGKMPEAHLSGMLYDGQPGPSGVRSLPPVTPPCIWFPYGRMGQSATEPRWDTTGGKFGPFAGQCFVGDETKSIVMRVVLEKVNGRYQGACIPFRSGFECGVNRLVFGPDGSLYAGMTNRGWGSVGGKPYGLQRLVYTGRLPFEIHSVHLTRDGFDLTFTKPLDPESASHLGNYSVQSFTYNYWSTYGSPEVDHRAEKLRGVTVAPDGRRVSLAVGGFRRGRVYELHLEGVKSAEGEAVLHPEAYYTLNEVPE